MMRPDANSQRSQGLEPAAIGVTPLTANYQDLEDKGYLVIPDFLSAFEIYGFRENFAEQPSQSYEKYIVKNPHNKFLHGYLDKFRAVTDLVVTQTAIHADVLVGGVYFMTHGEQVFGWHQDRDSYYFCQNHYDYLNFYIPLIKPDKNRSNLSLIPFDRLQARSPEFCKRILGKGASLFEVYGRKTVLVDENQGWTGYVLDYSLDELAETPALGAGDLLLLRGDVIHRTQDADTLRVALSVRFAKSCQEISRANLVKGGTKKFEMMVHEHIRYQKILGYMGMLGTNSVQIREITHKSSQAFEGKRMMSRFEFFLYLLQEKIKMGLFLNAAKIVGEVLREHLRSVVLK